LKQEIKMKRYGTICNFITVSLFACILLPASFSFAAEVVMDRYKYIPQKVEIKQGETVKWTNKATLMHTVTGGEDCTPDDGWGSGLLFPEKMKPKKSIYEMKFDKSGTYRYFCKTHCSDENMVGEVVVK
jgi:plastocyanin